MNALFSERVLPEMKNRVKAIGLMSGGLDSMLAARLLQEQDIEVIGYTFVTPFFGPDAALRAKEQIKIELRIVEITDPYMTEVLKDPRYGYGKNMNPCIDCHAYMFRRAGDRMEDEGAGFLFSGEVLGERPFSQNKGALRAVANMSGYGDRNLRPLSAKLLEETTPEKTGLVDRSRLLDIQGRARGRQMELARVLGLTHYPKPAGGCLLTEPNFSKRLRDLLKHVENPLTRDLDLLKVGRHFRWDERFKVVVGRKHAENKRIEELWKPGDMRLWVKGIPGPTVLVPFSSEPPSPEALLFAARLAVRYSDAPRDCEVEVDYTAGENEGVIETRGCSEEMINEHMI